MKRIELHNKPMDLFSLFIYSAYNINALSDKIFYDDELHPDFKIKTRYRASNYLLTGVMIKKIEYKLNIFEKILLLFK